MAGIFERAAHNYAKAGFGIFPLIKNGKKPFKDTNGLYQATTDFEQVSEWASQHPNANIGIRTGEASGITVIDIDPKNAAMETVAELKAQGRRLPKSAMVRTPSGGWHFYFAYTADLLTGSNRIGKGIDVRSDGGYIVAPPSQVHGRTYVWLTWPENREFEPVPRWVFDYVQEQEALKRARRSSSGDYQGADPEPKSIALTPLMRRRYEGVARVALAGRARDLSDTKEGSRNDTLFRAASYLGRFVLNGIVGAQEVRAALLEACDKNGLLGENGARDVHDTISDGFAMAEGEDLPVLVDRPRAS